MGCLLPKGMLLGAATAATQIEGGKVNSNWNEWSNQGRILDGSTCERACDHWNRWKEDLDLLASMKAETYRFSIEWARIEPEEGKFDASAIAHYREEISYMKKLGIVPLMTLHHFSNPLWFERKGAFAKTENVRFFLDFVKEAVKDFGDLVSDYVTINEPNVYALNGYAGQGWPPDEKSLTQAARVLNVMAGCHIRAYERIHRMREAMGYKDTRVGFAMHMRAFTAKNQENPVDRTSAALEKSLFQNKLLRAFGNGDFRVPYRNLGGFEKKNYCDFIGINYYTRSVVSKVGDNLTREGAPKSDFGWEIYAAGLTECVREAQAIIPGIPVWITENGICDSEDAFRCLFLYEQFREIADAHLSIERYYYWSFLDNFEWMDSESRRFGLVRVDYPTEKRTVNKSGRFFTEIVDHHGISDNMYDRYVRGEEYHL